ncbi:MAG: phosphohistidine phosphatase SixA [Cytophagales bacterium]|nr:phosphohistidine phosphatase SixA [Cytophagales bacterium]
MQRRIFIVRHAQAEPGTAQRKDELRALTSDGERMSQELGKFLNQKNSNLNLILTSPAVRAFQTATHIATELKTAAEIRIEKDIYSENLLNIFQLLTSVPDNHEEVMIVGHYPTIVELHNYLAHNLKLTIMTTAEMAVLHFDSRWFELTAGAAIHEFLFHPSHLPA